MTSDRAERHVMVPVELGGERRAAIAEIVETVARDGLPGPRDIDVALDAIGCVLTDGAPPARPPIQQEPVAWTIGGCFYKTLEEAHRHWDGDIRPLFAHPLPAQESGREWQPIETAPKDGTWILAWADRDQVPARISWGRNYKGDLSWCTTVNSFLDGYFTHWMPLPKAPEASS